MVRPTFYSGVLHALVAALAIFGLPQTQKEMRDFPEIPITVLTVAEFTALSRSKPEVEKSEAQPRKPTPRPPVVQPQRQTPPPPKIEPSKPEPPKTKEAAPIPEARPSPKPPSPKSEPAEPAPSQKVPEKTSQPEKAADAPSKTKKPEKKPDFVTAVLKTLEQREQQPPPESQDADKQPEKDPPQQTNAFSTQPMTISELDIVRRQFIACWNVPVGARAAGDLSVQIRVHVHSDGTVYESYLLEPQRAQSDSFYRAAAESALRAVRNPRCNPLRLPAGKYERWKVMTLNFDPKEMFD